MNKNLNTILVLFILLAPSCASGPEMVKKNYEKKTTTMRVLMRAFDSQEGSKNKIIQKIPCPNYEILEEEIKGDIVPSNQMNYGKKSNNGDVNYKKSSKSDTTNVLKGCLDGYQTTTTSNNVKYFYLTYRCR